MDDEPDPPPALDAADTTKPKSARAYAFAAGGKDHFAADRGAAREIMEMSPDAARIAADHRSFLGRVIAYVSEQGVHQFIDIGAGYPLPAGNVHDWALAANRSARVCYVDNDPSAMLHLQGQVEFRPQVVPLLGDLRDPRYIMTHATLNKCVDLGEPVAVILCAVLHYLGDTEAYEAVEYIKQRIAPGSFLVISHGTQDGATPGQAEKVRHQQSMMNTPIFLREGREIGNFFDGLQWVKPGLVNVNEWSNPVELKSQLILYGGVARKARNDGLGQIARGETEQRKHG
jgi:hypothetical protein